MDDGMVKCPACGSVNSCKQDECVYCYAKLNRNI